MLGFKSLTGSGGLSAAAVLGIVGGSTLTAVALGFAIYKWRIQRSMHSEIHSIMCAISIRCLVLKFGSCGRRRVWLRACQPCLLVCRRQYMPLEGNNYGEGDRPLQDLDKSGIKAHFPEEQC